MTQPSIEVLGKEDVRKALEALGSEAEGVLDAAVNLGAMEIRNAAADKAPQKTGNLRRSITATRSTDSSALVEYDIGTNLEYAAIHEYGGTIYPRGQFLVFEIGGETIFARSVTLEARPYLTPAFDEKKEAAKEVVGQMVAEAMQRVGQ